MLFYGQPHLLFLNSEWAELSAVVSSAARLTFAAVVLKAV